MEQNLPIITKKVWNMVRFAFFMLRKGICKKKILLNYLNLMMKKGMIASKVALNNLIFHHYHHHHLRNPASRAGPVENSPYRYDVATATPPMTNKKNYQYKQGEVYYSCMSSPNFEANDDEDLEEIYKTMESMLPKKNSGFMVRQVRVTDSPFPLQNDGFYDPRVDEAADEFIKRFYFKIKNQPATPIHG